SRRSGTRFPRTTRPMNPDASQRAPAAGRAGRDASPERISALSRSLARSFDTALREIDTINLQTRLLSFNAQVEAARAGHYGASFAVVASEMQTLSRTTESV